MEKKKYIIPKSKVVKFVSMNLLEISGEIGGETDEWDAKRSNFGWEEDED